MFLLEILELWLLLDKVIYGVLSKPIHYKEDLNTSPAGKENEEEYRENLDAGLCWIDSQIKAFVTKVFGDGMCRNSNPNA